jgi:hypothetical protein
MAKKRTTKGPIKRKTSSRRKPGVSVKLKPDPKFKKRLAQLGIAVEVTDQAALQIFLELRAKHPMLEVGLRLDRAYEAMKTAAYRSDNPEVWIKVARKTAGLD